MHQLFIIHKENKSGGAHALLRQVVNAQTATVGSRRLKGSRSICQHIIQHAGRHTLGSLCPNLIDHIQHGIDTLTGQCRKEQHRGIIHKLQVFQHLLTVLLQRAGFFVDGVPLIDYHHNSLALFVNHAGDFRILLGYTIVGIDEHQCHVAPADGRNGTKHAVPLQGFILNGTLTANAGSIDDIVLRTVHAGKPGINGITSRSGNVGHHGTLLPQ